MGSCWESLGILGGLESFFGGSGQQQRRELDDLLARAEIDESGALSFKLPSLENTANIASIGSSVVSVLHNIFGGYVCHCI